MFSFKTVVTEKGSALVMAILNITPDSFSDGGEAFSVDTVIEKVKKLCFDGADIIDVGACSTAPNNPIVDEAEELKRLKYFLPHIVKASTVPVSVDTFRPTVADYALSMGASIINDESGCFKNEMADVVKKYGAGWIFMHTGGGDSRKIADYNNNVTGEVLSFFSDMKHQATACGINEDQLCYDCGIGFGKSREDDLTLLSECDKLSQYSPLLIGVSRKRIIGYITGIENPKERDYPSGVVAAIAVSDGAQIVRVHNVDLTNEIISKGDI